MFIPGSSLCLQLLLERLQECAGAAAGPPACVSTILSVCQGVLSSPALSSVFTTKYELMVGLLARVCSFAASELQQPDVVTAPELIPEDASPPEPKGSPSSSRLFELLLQALTSYLSVQRQQANPNRVFTLVSAQLIQPLVLVRHLLTSGEHVHLRQQLCRDIRVKTDAILQQALFPSEHLTSYKEELIPSKEDSGKRGPGGAKGPLKPVSAILCKLSTPPLQYSVRSNTVSLLFKFFVESYRKGRGEGEEEQRMLCFFFLTRLLPALNVDLDRQTTRKDPESWSLLLLAVESLLSQALAADIYNVAADRIRQGEVQLNFYRTLGQMLFDKPQTR